MWQKIKCWVRYFVYFVVGGMFLVWVFGILIYIAYMGDK